METLNFRALRADEIDVRISTISEKACTLLLYKDARCDMNILDETVGATNWQRAHTRDNANCIVSIWDDSKGQWIFKEDVGKESYTEKEKGLASDSFKRACFNWGIGRELYTAPKILLWPGAFEVKEIKGKPGTYDTFAVDSIEIENHVIKALKIKRYNGNGVPCGVVFEWSDKKPENKTAEKPARLSRETIDEIRKLLEETKKTESAMLKYFKKSRIEDLTGKQAENLIRSLAIAKKKKESKKPNDEDDNGERNRRELDLLLSEAKQ